jgi:dolichol-phosphate mannosyltransferase
LRISGLESEDHFSINPQSSAGRNPQSEIRNQSISVDISVVLPTYDEGQNIGPLIAALRRALGDLRNPTGHPLSHEIIIVDAGSQDDTLSKAREAGARAFVQAQPGYGMALREGFAAARGRYVVTMDADLSHDPALLPAMMARISEADIVIASRYVKGGSSAGSAFRRLLSIILNRIYSLALRLPIRDVSCGYRIYDRKVLDGIQITGRNFDALEEILIRACQNGARIAEVPLKCGLRAHGKSHARIIPFAFSYLKTLVRMLRLRYSSKSSV